MTVGSIEVNRPFVSDTKPFNGQAFYDLDYLDMRWSSAYHRSRHIMSYSKLLLEDTPLSASSEATAVESNEHYKQPAIKKHVTWSCPPLDRVSNTSAKERDHASSCTPLSPSTTARGGFQHPIRVARKNKDENENRGRKIYRDKGHIYNTRLSPGLDSSSVSTDSSETICAETDEDQIVPHKDTCTRNPMILDGSVVEDGFIIGDKYVVESKHWS
ncbi:MAG: hypothetical protein Q9220_003993 [cf. Caloplaca sp. 1 TL-2023]